jgi:hypothetical protein
MVVNKVIAHFKDGTLIKGTTSDFSSNNDSFHVAVLDGVLVTVKIRDLKGVFFVKDFEGKESYLETYPDHIAGAGHKVKVNFSDGEEVIGFLKKYTPNRLGFFVTPANRRSNNERIFVVAASCRQVGFMI